MGFFPFVGFSFLKCVLKSLFLLVRKFSSTHRLKKGGRLVGLTYPRNSELLLWVFDLKSWSSKSGLLTVLGFLFPQFWPLVELSPFPMFLSLKHGMKIYKVWATGNNWMCFSYCAPYLHPSILFPHISVSMLLWAKLLYVQYKLHIPYIVKVLLCSLNGELVNFFSFGFLWLSEDDNNVSVVHEKGPLELPRNCFY